MTHTAVVEKANGDGLWKDVAKWSIGALLALTSFIAVTFGFSRITALEGKQHESEKKVERMDQKLDDLKAGVERIERKLDEKKP